MIQLPESMPPHVAQAFDDYCALGHNRSLKALHTLYRQRISEGAEPPSRRLNTLGEWSKRYGWQTLIAMINSEEAMLGRIAAGEAISGASMAAVDTLVSLLNATRTLVTPKGETIEVPDSKVQLAAANAILDRAGFAPMRRTALELSGADGGPVQVDHRHLHAELNGLTPAELLARLQNQALSGALPPSQK